MAKASFGVSPVHPALPFTVDTFEPNHAGKPQFVTHAHKDHAVDIEQHATDIWCTETTRQLLLIRFPALARPRTTFHILAMPNPHGSDFEAEMDDHEPQQVMAADGTVFSVMAIPSQHCDGAAMLLFEVERELKAQSIHQAKRATSAGFCTAGMRGWMSATWRWCRRQR